MITFLLTSVFCASVFAGQIAITIDDIPKDPHGGITRTQRTKRIIDTLKKHDIRAAIFVRGKFVTDKESKAILKMWDTAGHIIGNHSQSHLNYGSPEVGFDRYSSDISRNEQNIKHLNNFVKIYRFPFLKHGDTKQKRDKIRRFLKDQGYSYGYVTVDASDWYIDRRMLEKLKKNRHADLTPYKRYYLDHIKQRVKYYDGLAKKVVGRDVKHTILIHDNYLNAMFLDDLIEMLKENGWTIVDADIAFKDPIHTREPDIVPAGESIIWALAKETGRYDDMLRYPGESMKYEKEAMDNLGL